MYRGWGVLFYFSLFQGWARLQGVRSGLVFHAFGPRRCCVRCRSRCLAALVRWSWAGCLSAALRGLGAAWFKAGAGGGAALPLAEP